MKNKRIEKWKSPKETPYDYLYYSFVANLPLEGGYRESFNVMWQSLDRIIKKNYVKKKVIK